MAHCRNRTLPSQAPDDRYPSAQAVLDALRAGRTATPEAHLTVAPTALAQEDTPTAAMPRPAVSPRPRPVGRRRSLVAIGLVAVVGALWASVLPHVPPPRAVPSRAVPSGAAHLVVYNRLTAPIVLTLDDSGFTVGPDDSVRLPVRAGRPLEAHWAMVRPAGADGRMLGNELEGSIVAEEPRGELRQLVAAAADGRPRFSPLVVNATPWRLRVMVESGNDRADCGCIIAPGDSLSLGYYSLEPGSGIRVTNSARASGRFDAAAAGVDATTGAVVFRVTPRSLVVPGATRPNPSRLRAAERSPVRSFLPVR